MLTRVLKTIKENSMLKAGDKVICAFSGGADSMALLCALYALKDELGIEVVAAHLNHSIRGEAAEGDYLFVKDFCQRLGVRLFYKKLDIPSIAAQAHIGEEEAGRIERYRFFNLVAEELGAAKIATGHHKNDNAETVLFNLFRGSGLKGLRGIPYKRDNIIRPMLDVPKKTIEAFLEGRGIGWREDATNKDCTYSRNRIRNIILKEIEEHFPGATEKIADASEIIKIDEDCLDAMAKDSGAFCEGVIKCDKFAPLHESLKRRVVIRALEYWGVCDIDFTKICIVKDAVMGETGKVYDMGDGVRLVKSYNDVYKMPEENRADKFAPHNVPVGESLEIKAFEGVWSIKTVDKTEKIRDNKMMILLDAEKLPEGLLVRCRKEGDFISPSGMPGTKKLKKVFIDLKIPTEIRDRISMLTIGNEILFIPGIRKTKHYLPDENTKKILVAEYKRAE